MNKTYKFLQEGWRGVSIISYVGSVIISDGRYFYIALFLFIIGIIANLKSKSYNELEKG